MFDVTVCCLRYPCDPHQRPQSSCDGQHYNIVLFPFILQETDGAGCVACITRATPLVAAWNYVCSVMCQLMIL